MPSLGAPEILVIFVVALLVLGPKKLPEAGRQVGKALAEFRRWSNGIQGELRQVLDFEADTNHAAPSYTDTDNVPTVAAAPPVVDSASANGSANGSGTGNGPTTAPAPGATGASVPTSASATPPASAPAPAEQVEPEAKQLRPPWQFPEQQSFN